MLSILLNLLFGFLCVGQLQFVYDSEERLLRVSNENWEHYHFDLDDAGFVIGERGFDRGYRSYQRDRAGRVIRETLPSGKFKEYEYDRCGRVTRITHDYDKVEEQTYSYYSSGRLQEAKNEHALVSFRYDNMGLPVEERCNEHRILRTYDWLGQIATLTSSLGANLVYERNEFGELLNFKARQDDAENHFVSEHWYDSLGFELERMLPGGISQSFAYDNIGRLVDSKTRQSSKVRRERKYHWGKADRLLKTEDSWYGTTTYEYSATGHLQKATYADGREEYRLSDKVGNLFDDPERKLRKYLQGGKIEQAGEWHFEYDKDGQLTEKYKGSGKWWETKRERWQYEWNQNGTLKAVRSPHRQSPVEFTYDALGRRLSKLASEYTHWVWNGNVPLHEWNSGKEWKDGAWKNYELDLKTWVFEEESFVPLALLQEGRVYSIVTDQLGTPTEAYDQAGQEVWRRRLDMNGKVLEEVYDRNAPYSERVRIPFLFQGQYCDHETGLAYNRFRYYDPELGRYISEDPIRFNSGITALHSYVEDTNSWIDVFGLAKSYNIQNPKSARNKVRKGQGPSEIDRIDAPEQSVPGSQWHAHGKGKHDGAINLDGSIHDSDPKFSNATKKMVKRTRMEFITGEVYQKILVSNLFDKILGIVFSDGKFEEIPLVERYSDIEFLFKYLHKQEVSTYLVSIAGQLLFDSNACFKRELSKLIYDNIFSCLTFVDFEQEVDDVGFCIPNLFFSTHTTVKYLGSTEPLDLDSSSLFYKTYAKTIKGNSAKIYRTTSQQGGVEVERMYMILPKESS